MNPDVYPQDVDFKYKIRCSAHNLKPYVYCEMCMLRTQVQEVKEETDRRVSFTLAQSYIALNDMRDIVDRHSKQIAELQIEINLLKSKSQ